MANNKNLKPFTSGQSHDKAVENGRKGGIKSGESKRAKKTMKEVLDYLLTKEITNKKTGGKSTTIEAICVAQIAQALNGNTKAFKEIRDTIGEMPVQEIRNITPPTIIDDV